MKEFDPQAKCEKCGDERVNTFYCPGGPDRVWGRLCTWNEGEHLHRTCQRCLYQWKEACIGHD